MGFIALRTINSLEGRRGRQRRYEKLIAIPSNHFDRATLEAALVGYEVQRDVVDAKIAEIRRQLGGRGPRQKPEEKSITLRAKRTMSAAARKRIAAAQKKRWAAYRKAKAK